MCAPRSRACPGSRQPARNPPPPTITAGTACSPPSLARLEDGWWRTHGLPPQSGTVTADAPPSASPRSAVPAGTTSAPAGGTTGETRCPSQTLRLQVVAARASRSPTPRPRRRLARPAAPQPPPPSPNVRPPRPGGQAPTFGVTGLAARPGPPRAAPRRPRGRRAMAAVPSPPSRCGKRGQQVRRWLEAVADAPSAPVVALAFQQVARTALSHQRRSTGPAGRRAAALAEDDAIALLGSWRRGCTDYREALPLAGV